MDVVKRWQQEECTAHCFDDNWRRRSEAEKEARPWCHLCGLTRQKARDIWDWDLHVHHLTYKHEGHELSCELIPVCWACHLGLEHFKPVPFSRCDSFDLYSEMLAIHLDPTPRRSLEEMFGPELYKYFIKRISEHNAKRIN